MGTSAKSCAHEAHVATMVLRLAIIAYDTSVFLYSRDDVQTLDLRIVDLLTHDKWSCFLFHCLDQLGKCN